jgi:hypothetical protein
MLTVKRAQHLAAARALAVTTKARFVDLGLEPYATSPAEFGKFIADYTEKWGKVILWEEIMPTRQRKHQSPHCLR